MEHCRNGFGALPRSLRCRLQGFGALPRSSRCRLQGFGAPPRSSRCRLQGFGALPRSSRCRLQGFGALPRPCGLDSGSASVKHIINCSRWLTIPSFSKGRYLPVFTYLIMPAKIQLFLLISKKRRRRKVKMLIFLRFRPLVP